MVTAYTMLSIFLVGSLLYIGSSFVLAVYDLVVFYVKKYRGRL